MDALKKNTVYVGISSVIICFVYILTHQYFPASYAGYYLSLATQLVSFPYPPIVQDYTVAGLPGVYPPLGLLIIGILSHLTPFSPIWFAGILPTLYVIGFAIIFYRHTIQEFDINQRIGLLGAVAVVASPQVLEVNISSNGITTAPAYLFFLLGMGMIKRVYIDEEDHTTVIAGIMFGLTVLTHPAIAVAFGLVYLSGWVWLSHSLSGFLRGLSVATIGGIVSAVWWLPVINSFGWAPFKYVLSSGGVDFTQTTLSLMEPLSTLLLISFPLMVILAMWSKDADLAMLLTPVLFIKYGIQGATSAALFLLMISSIISISKIYKMGVFSKYDIGNQSIRIITGFLLISGTLIGAGYVAQMPSGVPDGTREATAYVSENTPQDATVVALGPSQPFEWTGYLTNRQLAGSHYGAEWTARFTELKQAEESINSCDDSKCLTEELRIYNISADYIIIYNIKHRSPVTRALSTDDWGPGDIDIASFRSSPKYRIMVQEGDVIVVEVLSN